MHLEGIPATATCPGIDGSRLAFLRSQLEEGGAELAASYGASGLLVDSCTTITWCPPSLH